MDRLMEIARWVASDSGLTLACTILLVSVLLGIGVWIWQRTRTITLLDRALAQAWQTSKIQSYKHSDLTHSDELARARRYHRALSVAVVNLEGNEAHAAPGSGDSNGNGNGNGNGSGPRGRMQPPAVIFPLVGYILRDALRESDVVTSHAARNQYVLFLIETSRSQAAQAVGRLTDLAYRLARVNLRVGIAEYPADGLTVEDLVFEAETNCSLQAPTATPLDHAVVEQARRQNYAERREAR
jgi:hypothetical protein